MYLVFARHGESVYNAEGRVQGQSNVPLSELGRRQAEALGEFLADEPFAALMSSPLARARETAAIVGRHVRRPIEFDDDLMEINAGVFQGLLWSEIADFHPDAARKWHSRKPDYRIPEGESRRDLMRRGLAVMERIRESNHERVLVIGHGGLLTSAFKALLAIPAERSPFLLANASISRAEWVTTFQLLSLNETAHLRGLDATNYPWSGQL